MPTEMMKKKNVSQRQHSAAVNPLVPGYVFLGKSGRRYELVERLGRGGMGTVFAAKPIDGTDQQHQRCAIKTEKSDRRPARVLQRKGLRIAMEKLILKACRRSIYFPDYIDAGRTDSFGWIAMEMVGESLYSLHHKAPNRKFSDVTCLRIAVQVVKGLRDLHGRGFVHRDVKPDNLAIGRGAKASRIYILDAGIARQYKTVDGVPIKPRIKVRFQGSRDFAPLCRHMEEEFGPRDDIEGLFYVLAYFLNAVLPWKGINEDKRLLIAKYEAKRNPKVLFGDSELSPVLCELWRYIAGLRYADVVDYEYLVNVLNAALVRIDGGANRLFEWQVWEKMKTHLSVGE